MNEKTVKRTTVPALLSIGLLLSPLAVQAESALLRKRL